MGIFPEFAGQLFIAMLPIVAKWLTALTLSVGVSIVKNSPSVQASEWRYAGNSVAVPFQIRGGADWVVLPAQAMPV